MAHTKKYVQTILTHLFSLKVALVSQKPTSASTCPSIGVLLRSGASAYGRG